MNDYASKPAENTPIALRLVPRITGWSIRGLVNFLTVPIVHAPEGAEYFYLDAYQWNHGAMPTQKPVPALTKVLKPAADATNEHDAVAAIPPDLFVFTDDLDAGFIQIVSDHTGEPLFLHEQPDWRPNVHCIEDLIEQCPEPLWTICSLADAKRARSREEGKVHTAQRNEALQRNFDAIKYRETQQAKRSGGSKPTKKYLCRKLAADRSANPDDLAPERIERLVKMRN